MREDWVINFIRSQDYSVITKYEDNMKDYEEKNDIYTQKLTHGHIHTHTYPASTESKQIHLK